MKNFTLLLCLIALSQFNHAQIKKAAAPSWLVEVAYSSEPDVNYDDLTQGTLTLLYDQQIHIPKQATYRKYVTKIFENVGVQDASTINVSYDPTYQSLTFHSIVVHRNGASIDKLNVDNFQLMRREADAENHLYDGSMSAVMNISDVRTGDILEYSYTITGFNPIHKGKFSRTFYLNNYEPIGTISVQLISKDGMDYKGINTKDEPVIKDFKGLQHYTWLKENTKKVTFEDYSPDWKLDYQMIQVSDYKTWEEVINWGLDVYSLKETPNAALLEKIKSIDTEHKTKGEKIKAALSFVQEDIRYLGLEDGIGAYQPFTPNKVFDQRFGDCKDKSLLLCTMLEKMDIEAYPMLVNTYLKQTITEFLPSPVLFDHCVVKVLDDKGKAIYYDPTMTHQGGTYKTTYFPDYRYALVLQPENTYFDQIFNYFENKSVVSDEYVMEVNGKGATLNVTSTFYDSEADYMRRYFKNNSINSVTKDYENYYANYYFNIESIKKPEFKDDLEFNKFEVTESYKIDSIWRPMPEKDNYIAASFSPTSIDGILYTPNSKQRKDPLSLAFPSTKEHKIKVKLNSRWSVENENKIINFSGFQYKSKVNYNKLKNEIDLSYSLKIQKDHIPVEEFQDYTKEVNKVNDDLGYYIYTRDTSSLRSSDNNFGDRAAVKDAFFKIFVIIAVFFALIVLIVFLIWYVQKNKRDTTYFE